MAGAHFFVAKLPARPNTIPHGKTLSSSDASTHTTAVHFITSLCNKLSIGVDSDVHRRVQKCPQAWTDMSTGVDRHVLLPKYAK